MGSSAINLTGPLGPAQFRNKLINGDFSVCQRGNVVVGVSARSADGATVDSLNTGYTLSVPTTYSCDRFFIEAQAGLGFSGSESNSDFTNITGVPRISMKRQGFTLGYPERDATISDVDASRYYQRVTIGAADGTNVFGVTGSSMDMGDSFISFGQHIDSELAEFSNQTVHLSFLARSFGSINEPTIGCRLSVKPDFNNTRLYGSGSNLADVVPDTTGVTIDIRKGVKREINILADDIQLKGNWQKFTRKFKLPTFDGVTLGTDEITAITPTFMLVCGNSGPSALYSKSTHTDFLGGAGKYAGLTGAFDIAQIQLEIGSDVSPFEKRHPQIEIEMCKRYYHTTYTDGIYAGQGIDTDNKAGDGVFTFRQETVNGGGGHDHCVYFGFPTTMRVAPSISIYSMNTGRLGYASDGSSATGVGTPADTALMEASRINTKGCMISNDIGVTDAYWTTQQWYMNLTLDAEL